MKTENRPSADVNFAQVFGLGIGVSADGVEVFDGSFGGRSVCSCALMEELSPIVITRATKKTFICDTPSFTRRFGPADYNPVMDADDTDLKAL